MRVVLLLSGLLALGAARADDAGSNRCRTLADDRARLACYDALPLAAPAAAAPAPAPAAAAVQPPPAPAPQEARFGLETPAAQPESISTSFPGTFTGWEPKQRLRLANGQVWQVQEGNSGAYYLRDPKVKVRRTVFGGFMMEVEGVTPLIRVRRVE